MVDLEALRAEGGDGVLADVLKEEDLELVSVDGVEDLWAAVAVEERRGLLAEEAVGHG